MSGTKETGEKVKVFGTDWANIYLDGETGRRYNPFVRGFSLSFCSAKTETVIIRSRHIC